MWLGYDSKWTGLTFVIQSRESDKNQMDKYSLCASELALGTYAYIFLRDELNEAAKNPELHLDSGWVLRVNISQRMEFFEMCCVG